MGDRVVEDYRGYQLVAAAKGASFVGKAWKDGTCILNADGNSLSEVLVLLKISVTKVLEHRAESEPPPDVAQCTDALRAILPSLSDRQLAMLKAHYRAKDRCLTATDLAKAAGYANYSAVNLQYGNVGRLMWEAVPRKLPVGADGEPIYTFALAEAGDRDSPEHEWVWRMRPEVAAAIKELGLDV